MTLHVAPVLALSLLLALPVIVRAQAADPALPETLSLQECIALAQQQQIDVLTGQQAIASAQARATQANSAYYPTIGADFTPISANGSTGRTTGGGGTGLSLSIRQNIYDGGLRDAQASSARYGLTQSESALARTRQSVTFAVTRDYFGALRARHLAEVADARVTYLEGQLALVRTRVEVGDAARADELPVLAQLANARVSQLAAKNAIRTSLIQLQNTMGLTPQPAFAIQDIGAPEQRELPALETCLADAQAQRPDIAQAKAAVGVAQSSVTSAKLSMQPRLVSSGQYDLDVDGPVASNWRISAGVTYNLFDGKRSRAVYDESRAGLQSAEQRAAQVAKNIHADVQDAYLNVANAQERIAAADLSLQAAEQNFTAQEARYKEGLAIPLDLLNAQVDVANAQSNAVQARYDYYVALAQLDYAIGK